MLPANFPGRKLLRRESALKRLGSHYRKSGEPTTLERGVLTSRVSIGFERARAIRTKKDRTARAKLARNA